MKRIAVLSSGRGSNFQAIADAILAGTIPAVCVALITDNPGCYAAVRAGHAGIPVTALDYRRFPAKDAYEAALLSEMESWNPDLFILAGYMRILGKEIVRRFPGRIINIHPALLPSFPGLHAQRQALEWGVRYSGCTVHFVDEEMDQGPIILQSCVPVREGDSEAVLSDRILAEEHACLPEAIRLFCEDRLRIEGRRVKILDGH